MTGAAVVAEILHSYDCMCKIGVSKILGKLMHTVETPRLRLILCDLKLFDCCLAGERKGVLTHGGIEDGGEWLEEEDYIRMRLGSGRRKGRRKSGRLNNSHA